LHEILEEARAVVSATLAGAAAPDLPQTSDRAAVEAWENEGDPN